jgi:hypothetical protein
VVEDEVRRRRRDEETVGVDQGGLIHLEPENAFKRTEEVYELVRLCRRGAVNQYELGREEDLQSATQLWGESLLLTENCVVHAWCRLILWTAHAQHGGQSTTCEGMSVLQCG